MVDPDPWLTGPQCAERIGVKANSWRVLVRRGQAPAPDDADDAGGKPVSRRRPRWRTSTVDEWLPTRPGKGRRFGRRYIVPFSGELR